MKKLILLLHFILFVLTFSFAQTVTPGIEWARCYGGTNGELSTDILQKPDGGFLIISFTRSNNGDVSGNHGGGSDYWIVSTDYNGNIIWQKCYGGFTNEYAYSALNTSDGGFLVVGDAESSDGDVIGNHGGASDYWLIKLDSAGTLLWQKCIGGTNSDGAHSIINTTDGGFIVAGSAASNNGDLSGNHGSWDYGIVKLDSAGNIQWHQSFGGSLTDAPFNIVQSADGGYAVAGVTKSGNGNVIGYHGGWDYWVIKLDSAGNLLWQNCLGGSLDDYGYGFIATNDNGYLVTGTTMSIDGDVYNIHGNGECWLVKLDSSGNLQWQTSLGGSSGDGSNDIIQSMDGNYVVAATTQSNDGNVNGNNGDSDGWVVKINSLGNVLWQKCIGGTKSDFFRSIIQTAEGGYALSGYTYSSDGSAIGNHDTTTEDSWVIKLFPDTTTGISTISSSKFNIQTTPNPFTNELAVSIPQLNSEAQLTLLDVFGKQVLTQTIPAKTLNLKLQTLNLAQGVYFLQLQNGKQTVTRKVIKM